MLTTLLNPDRYPARARRPVRKALAGGTAFLHLSLGPRQFRCFPLSADGATFLLRASLNGTLQASFPPVMNH